jgi:hypothetical protein
LVETGQNLGGHESLHIKERFLVEASAEACALSQIEVLVCRKFSWLFREALMQILRSKILCLADDKL